MSSLIEQLKAEIRTGKVLAVVGAGVSVGATAGNPLASWMGLLKHGVEFCTNLQLELPPGWKERTIAQIDSGDITDMTSAAQNVADRLEAPGGGDFRKWLRESVGALTVVDSSTIQAILDLNVPVATTNYDSLFTKVSGLPHTIWTSPTASQRWDRNDHDSILHLHGHWETPESVVLGGRSYDEVLKDEMTQALLKGFLISRTLLFIGYGSGLSDPNFASLLKWSRRILPQTEYAHYRLVLNKHEEAIRKQHQGDRIRVIGFGETYDAFPTFLQGLGATPKTRRLTARTEASQLRQLAKGRSDLFRRKALLFEQKATMAPDDFISELGTLADALTKMGSIRSAVSWLHSPLLNAYDTLSFSVRTEKGLILVEILLKASDFDFARRALHKLFPDCTGTETPPAITEKFWTLAALCYMSLFDAEETSNAFLNAIQSCTDEERRKSLEADRDEFLLLKGALQDLRETEGDA